MAIRHTVRCDNGDCEKEEPLVIVRTERLEWPIPYSMPASWQVFDDRHFCSYQCVSDYADEKAHD